MTKYERFYLSSGYYTHKEKQALVLELAVLLFVLCAAVFIQYSSVLSRLPVIDLQMKIINHDYTPNN